MPFDRAMARKNRRELADQYAREVLPNYNLEPDMMSDLSGAIGASLLASEGSRMRFKSENWNEVTYAQTHAGLPVWGAGLTVWIQGQPEQITHSRISVHNGIVMELPPENSSYWPEKIDEAVLKSLVGLTETSSSLRIDHIDMPLIICLYDGCRGACGPVR